MEANAATADNPAYKIMPFAMLAMYFLFPMLLLFLSYSQEGQWANSIEPEAFLKAKFFLEFSAVVALDAVFAVFIVGKLKRASPNAPGNKIVPFALAEFPVLMGFVLSFINNNAYLVLPYLGLSLYLWIYFYTRKEE